MKKLKDRKKPTQMVQDLIQQAKKSSPEELEKMRLDLGEDIQIAANGVRFGLSARIASHGILLFSYLLAVASLPFWAASWLHIIDAKPGKEQTLIQVSELLLLGVVVLVVLGLAARCVEWVITRRTINHAVSPARRDTKLREEFVAFSVDAIKGLRIWIYLLALILVISVVMKDVMAVMLNLGYVLTLFGFCLALYFLAGKRQSDSPQPLENA